MCYPRSRSIGALSGITRSTWLILLLITGIANGQPPMDWNELPDLPNPIGLAGPVVGVHNNTLLVGGGANFAPPVWEANKEWHTKLYALETKSNQELTWLHAGELPYPLAYAACVSTPHGVVVVGGNNAEQTFASCFLMRWDSEARKTIRMDLPSLPVALAYGQAAVCNGRVYVAGGQTGADLQTAVQQMWSIGFATTGSLESVFERQWRSEIAWPGPPRAFNMLVEQNNGFDDCLYLISGRYQDGATVRFLKDCWEYNPRSQLWRERASLPVPMVAGTGIDIGQSHILTLSGDSGENFLRTDELRDAHPGFPRRVFAFHTITNTWTEYASSPSNQVTTTAVHFDGSIVIPSGEVRPRVRTPKVWRFAMQPTPSRFAGLDYLVLIAYLSVLIGIGIYFARQTTTTDDYFRGAGRIPWWVAGCSIFATMLSSLTFTGVPSKAFAQDWVYAVGNMMIPLVAVIAVYVALPFYRHIDATSAYEYLEKRFSPGVRRFGSCCFSVFHIFRMAIVMSLTGLALAVATPLTPMQSVLLMGLLSVIYCSVGGVSAVVWTDTLQTVVLLGGAILAIGWMLSGSGLGAGEAIQTAVESGKMNCVNWQWSPSSAQVAFWVIVVGGIGQNISSYTADQAVVQRYMTTPSQSLAARSIWTNALLTLPATVIFFGIGTALYLFYSQHPDRLDPSITTDQVFPHFIASELPMGLAGLIVAAIFAAAQSTVSTSMNSVATTMITDFFKPHLRWTEHGFLRAAQALTIVLGCLGTLLALFFIDPSIRSLFDQFVRVIGLFMGVLGGLFVLGVFCPRANTLGAWAGALGGAMVMLSVDTWTDIHPYLFTAIGITSCVGIGLVASLLAPPSPRSKLTWQGRHGSSTEPG